MAKKLSSKKSRSRKQKSVKMKLQKTAKKAQDNIKITTSKKHKLAKKAAASKIIIGTVKIRDIMMSAPRSSWICIARSGVRK